MKTNNNIFRPNQLVTIILLLTGSFWISAFCNKNKEDSKVVPKNTALLVESAPGNNEYAGNVIAEKGAWCWFADPRALHYESKDGKINSTYVGYIDVHGNIKASQYDFNSGIKNDVLIRSYFQPDDHDNPSFLVLPDERIMVFYSRHTDEACFYYRVSEKAGDITSLGAEMKIKTRFNTTYPSPFILADDPTHFYLCWRGIRWHPTIARYSLPDAQDKVDLDWGPYQMVQSTASRPYCKYYSNGKDKIYLAYTTGHPDVEYPNYTYFNYIDINTLQLKDIKDNVLSTIADGPHHINKTDYDERYPIAVVDSPTDQRDWIWQTTLDPDDKPVIAMVQISKDKKTHNYYYVRWTGTEWQKTFLANGGGHFHQTEGLELCYSGGMAIDGANSKTVYCSMPVDGKSGKVYEIMKFNLSADGKVASTEQVTTNSPYNNVRPYIVANSGNSLLKLLWMHGNYYDWIVSSRHPKGFATAIHGDFSFPSDKSDLKKGLLLNEGFNKKVDGTAYIADGKLVVDTNTYATLKTKKTKAFTVSLTPCINENAYEGVILTIGDLEYGLDASTLKPYINFRGTEYNSNNLLGNSDSWQTEHRGTGGKWWTPVKLKYFDLTLTYDTDILTIYRNGLIDQVIEVNGLKLDELVLGGFKGWVDDCRIYDRRLSQNEIQNLIIN